MSMPNLMVNCLFRLQENGVQEKWDFFQGDDGLSFFQMAGFELLM
jgi:hypothetical protein